jgi:hypothetical protein
MILIIVIVCLAVLSIVGVSADAQSPKNQLIKSYEGNFSQKELVPIDLLSFIGPPAYFFAEAVKFKAPRAGWKINAVQTYGWDRFNGTSDSIPSEHIIALEVRDKDLNLLYKFADSQIPYSNFVRNATIMYPITIEIPSISVSDDFYVCFYARGAMEVLGESLNETSSNSFIFIEDGIQNQLIPANLRIGDNQTMPVNWIMSVSGN